MLRLFTIYFLSYWTFCLLIPIQASAMQASETPPYDAPGKLIDLGGWTLHLYCTGPDDGILPTVIVEAGAGAFSTDWSLVQAESGESFRMCTYDRAGTGWSSAGPAPRTLRQLVWELHTLLELAGISPPYVLAGHSFGGTLVRLFALTYPSETAGLVLVNSIHELEFRAMQDGEVVSSASTATGRPVPEIKTGDPLDIAALPEDVQQHLGEIASHMSSQPIPSPYDNLPGAAKQMRTWSFGQKKHWVAIHNPWQNEELNDLMTRLWEHDKPLGDLPVLVLSQDIDGDADEDDATIDEFYEKYQAQFLTLSGNSRQVLIKDAGHELHIYAPELVYESIREFVESIMPDTD